MTRISDGGVNKLKRRPVMWGNQLIRLAVRTAMSIGPTEGEHLRGKRSTYQNRLSTQNLKPINLSKCSYQKNRIQINLSM